MLFIPKAVQVPKRHDYCPFHAFSFRMVLKERALCNNRNLFPCFQGSGSCTIDATEADCFPVCHIRIPEYCLVSPQTPHPIKPGVTYRLWNLVSNGLISTDPNDPRRVLCNGGFGPGNGNMSKNVVTLLLIPCLKSESNVL